MPDYNASEIDRLVREGREDDERMKLNVTDEDADWSARQDAFDRNAPWFIYATLQIVARVGDPHWEGGQRAAAIARTRNNLAAMVAALSAAKAEVERLTTALTKISAIRDSIVGCQGFNFSEHAYPLVAVLDAAGFKGAGYEIASKNLGTLIEQRNAAERERDRLSARVRELELTEEERAHLQALADDVRSMRNRAADLLYAPHGDALTVLDRLAGRSKP